MFKRFFLINSFILLITSNSIAGIIENWDITLKNKIQILPVLTIQEEVETYTGDLAIYDSTQTPHPNHVYVIANIQVKQTPQTTHSFNPEEILLVIGDKTYKRLNPDDFMEKFKYITLPHLKIKKGTFTGVIIYEIPIPTQEVPLSLYYQNQIISDK